MALAPMMRQESDPSGREFVSRRLDADVVVVGAGPAGIAAALAAARNGARTVLVTDRPVLGGSASSEVRVTPSGADYPPWNRFARETGIMEEMSLRLAQKAALSGRWRWLYYDELYFDLVYAEPNLTVVLNTSVLRVQTAPDGRIASVTGVQLRSETLWEIGGRLFIDCSGDGTVGFLAGADYRVGRESKAEYGETHAPETADRGTMGATLLFSTVDRGHAVPYQAPAWALDVHELPTLLDPDKGWGRTFYRQPDGTHYGLWWAEYGGCLDSIHDDGDVVWHCRRLVYGLWDYIRNSGKFDGVERQEIDWVAYLPGKRESRRLLGPVIATARDFLAQRSFADAIGFCGWPIDIHPPYGYADPEPACTHDFIPGITDIPFGCLYSRNVRNLLFAGRDISVSHEGLGTLRVIATTAVMGQAVGTAAALCLDRHCLPDELRTRHIGVLQQRLLRQDQSIVGRTLNEPDGLSREARVTASSVRVLAATECTQWRTLTDRFGLVLPVATPRLTAVELYLDATVPTDVRLDLHLADQPQNYRFSRRAGGCTRRVSGRGWVRFDLDAEIGPGLKAFVVLHKNPAVRLGFSAERFPGVLGIQTPDVPELTAANSLRCLPTLPCFRLEPAQNVFSPQALVDGHIRPHGLPHCWCSGPVDPGAPAWVELQWGKAVTVGAVEVVFDSDLNVKRHDIVGMYPGLARDYDVVAVSAPGQTETLARVRGNTQRLARHALACPTAVTALRLVLYSTWGNPCVAVFDLRAYA